MASDLTVQHAARAQDLAGLASRASELARRAQSADDGGAADAAERFEELLASLLVKELRRATPEGLFGEGPGADVYEGWFDEHVGKSLARELGLAEVVRASLLQKGAAASGAEGA